jgi:hypothetical protein
MDASEILERLARDYEILAVSLAERASLSADNGSAATGFVVVAIVLRELARALEEAA